MRKKYQQPVVDIIKIRPIVMLINSVTIGSRYDGEMEIEAPRFELEDGEY